MAPLRASAIRHIVRLLLLLVLPAATAASQTPASPADSTHRVCRLRCDVPLLPAPGPPDSSATTRASTAVPPAAAALIAGQPAILLDSAGGYARIEVDGVTGYVPDRCVKVEPGMTVSDVRGWERVALRSGAQVNCPPLTPVTDPKLDNFLRIIVGGADVVVRIISRGSGRCIRSLYIRGGERYEARNIPSDTYYLKYATGMDWRQKTVAGVCAGKFMRDAAYYEGEQDLDFHAELSSVPSYEVRLQISRADNRAAFPTTTISEEEFNK